MQLKIKLVFFKNNYVTITTHGCHFAITHIYTFCFISLLCNSQDSINFKMSEARTSKAQRFIAGLRSSCH